MRNTLFPQHCSLVLELDAGGDRENNISEVIAGEFRWRISNWGFFGREPRAYNGQFKIIRREVFHAEKLLEALLELFLLLAQRRLVRTVTRIIAIARPVGQQLLHQQRPHLVKHGNVAGCVRVLHDPVHRFDEPLLNFVAYIDLRAWIYLRVQVVFVDHCGLLFEHRLAAYFLYNNSIKFNSRADWIAFAWD